MSADQNPHLGARQREKPHIQCFLDWAHERGQTTTAQQLLKLIGNLDIEQALGSTLAFLTHPETAHALRTWSDRTTLYPLLSLAEELAVSPQLVRPLPTGAKTKKFFRGTLEEHYLSAQIASQLSSRLAPDEVHRLHRFRVWLFAIAYEALLAGFLGEASLRTICTQLRIGLEAQSLQGGNTRDTAEQLAKLRWFVDTAPADRNFNAKFGQYTIALRAQLDVHETHSDDSLITTRNALHRLINGEYRLLESRNTAGSQGGAYFVARNSNPRTDPVSATSYQLAVESLDVCELTTNPKESDCRLLKVQVEEPTAARELHAVSRRLALQKEEDRQYLDISWTQLSPWEKDKLSQLIEQGLKSSQHEEQLLAALTIVALVTKLSMRALGHVRFAHCLKGDDSDDKLVWVLDLRNRTLTRPASRHVNAAPRTPELTPWTAEISEEWVLQLSFEVVTPMSKAWAKNPGASSLAEIFPGSPESAFNHWTKSSRDLWRVSSGFLTIAGEQQAFEATGDSTFARLLLNWPSSLTSGPMAYPGWNRAAVATGLQSIAPAHVTALTSLPDVVNAMGSRLNLIDDLIAKEIRRANERIVEIAAIDDWVAFHNAFTTYCVTLLLVCTGARPARSVFERLPHFDLSRGRVFLDDKASLDVTGDKCGRIIPLPRIAVDLLEELYLPYLRKLQAQLHDLSHPLAADLLSVLGPNANPRIPLFFRLNYSNPTEWLEMTESALTNRRIFDWPLPANAFRHRMATSLRQARLSAELVDAHLGHAEAGTETFSDLSTRCWIDEEAYWRECVELALAPLSLTLPRLRFPDVTTHPPTGTHPKTDSKAFGAELRKLHRTEAASAAREEANQIFDAFKREAKDLASVTPEQWEALRDAIVFDENGNARSSAISRYSAFQTRLDRLHRDLGIKVSVRTWVLPQKPGKAAFGAAALQAPERIVAVREALDQSYEALDGTVPSRLACTWLCIADVAVNAGVSDPEILTCIANAHHERMALLVNKADVYLEICPVDRTVADGPVKRFLVPPRALPLLRTLTTKPLTKVYNRTIRNALTVRLLHSMQLDAADGIDKGIVWLCRWADHYNCLHRPGLQGGVMSGRISSYSLGRSDFVAASLGQRLVQEEESAEHARRSAPSINQKDQHPAWLASRQAPTKTGKLDARSLLGSLRATLARFHGRRKGSTVIDTQSGEIGYTRAKAAANMREAIRSADACVPRNILILADWAVHLLTRGENYKKELEGSSVARYLDSLSAGFLALSHTIDITDADQEEVTNFYQNVIDPTLADTEHDSEAKHKKAQQYVLDRLVEFHRYAERYGAVAPYWDEISEGLTNSAVSPGFITPQEYRLALSHLCPVPNNSAPTPLQRAFFLLLTYRFGLRGAEATHISARNWIEVADCIVLIVDHRHIKLKTPGSRRKVPLISALDAHELAVVHAWFAFRRGSTDFSANERLLVNVDGESAESDLSDLRTHVTAALRWATRNDKIKLHHARHSLANMVGLHLLPTSPDWGVVWGHCIADSALQAEHVRKLLLSRTETTRRATWAVSRMLGHSRRETTCASYLHFLLDWSGETARRQATTAFSNAPRIDLPDVTYLDAVPRASQPSSDKVTAPTTQYSHTCVEVAVKYLRSRSRGLTPSQAATGTFGRLAPEVYAQLEDLFGKVGARLVPPGSGLSPDPTERFARHLPKSRWTVLLRLAQQCDSRQLRLPLAALDQVSSSMQLMLAKDKHFEHFNLLISCLNLSPEDIAIRTPSTPNAAMEALLVSSRLQGFREPAAPADSRPRIGSYESFDARELASYRHRYSVLIRPSPRGELSNGLDLMTLWTCLVAADISY
ncbi:hypothetical protein [Hydrogenophaga sp. ANAO-22]|jgi:hypothetical protein|uniref:hypothetical protein n=1 Tax=Hydrogenophaga sp. ANAO-22 TaxID=3166645 RepID=UPI0036D424F2